MLRIHLKKVIILSVSNFSVICFLNCILTRKCHLKNLFPLCQKWHVCNLISYFEKCDFSGVPVGQGVPPPAQVAGGASIGRHEVEALLGGQRELVQSSRDMK